MDDKTKIELLWEERVDNKELLMSITTKLNNIELMLATARGGLKVTSVLWGVLGSVLTFVTTYFLNRKEH